MLGKPHRTRFFLVAIASAGIMTGSAGIALSQSWPDRNANERDDVTGYLCVDPGCTTLRLPDTKCLCQKLNPAERNVRKLRLKCSIVKIGPDDVCPVKSRYGISEY